MTERDRLIELLLREQQASIEYAQKKIKEIREGAEGEYIKTPFEFSADYLLENGVIVPPCKVEDRAYRVSTRSGTKLKYIQETTISRIAIDNEGIWLFCTCNPIAKCVFGKTVFLTREEAEQALKGGSE